MYKRQVCNGETGFTDTLPSEKTETGAWLVPPVAAGAVPENFTAATSISFAIPLATGIPGTNVHFEPVGYTGTDPNCPGTAKEPDAKAGHLCVYTGVLSGPVEADSEHPIVTLDSGIGGSAVDGASVSGASLIFATEANALIKGSWAVTAP